MYLSIPNECHENQEFGYAYGIPKVSHESTPAVKCRSQYQTLLDLWLQP